jgi:hypothetical protein
MFSMLDQLGGVESRRWVCEGFNDGGGASRQRHEAMITWRKIGVVVSALWLIGLPIFVMIDSNQRASEFYAWCRNAESHYATDMTLEQQLEWCSRSAKFMTPTVLAQVLIAGNADTFAMWSLMLGPVAVSWLIFGIISWQSISDGEDSS